jgi:hypothetical protein
MKKDRTKSGEICYFVPFPLSLSAYLCRLTSRSVLCFLCSFSCFCRLYFDVVLDCFFLLDIFVTFNSGVYVGSEYVHEHKKVALLYLKGYFVFDLLTYVLLHMPAPCTITLPRTYTHAVIFMHNSCGCKS